jgi:hypothetical protein
MQFIKIINLIYIDLAEILGMNNTNIFSVCEQEPSSLKLIPHSSPIGKRTVDWSCPNSAQMRPPCSVSTWVRE